jgi:hypothetical protein
MKDRFKKLPEENLEKWLRENVPETSSTQIPSKAHLMRILYAYGYSKGELETFCLAVIRKQHEGLACGEQVEERLQEIKDFEEALKELRGLPADEGRKL